MKGEGEVERVNLESFFEWAAELGISDSPTTIQSDISTKLRWSCLGQSLCVSNFPDAGGRGLAAARDLRKGELILRVPKSALITRECLLKDDISLSLAVQKYPSLSSTQILAVALLNEVGKGKSSLWYPYLVQLPRSYDTLASFGRFEMQALQVQDAIWTAERTTEKAEMEWEDASSLMGELNFKPQLQTFKAWLWSSATISSRTMHIPWDNAGCLCPVGDFFNYVAPGEDFYNTDDWSSFGSSPSLEATSSGNGSKKPDLNCSGAISQRLTDAGYEEDDPAYCFYSRRNYRKGEQVLLSYGTYTNLELLEHYGFLLNKNPNDKAFIPVETEVLSLCSWPKDWLYILQDGQPSFALVSALRLWTTPTNQRKSIAHLAYSGSQLPAESEIKVIRWIANNCQGILKNFPTSFEEDRLLLNIIDNMQVSFTVIELGKELSAFRDEIYAFLECNDLLGKENAFYKSRTIKSISRWKLAVKWRLMYKKILVDCISHCTERINTL